MAKPDPELAALETLSPAQLRREWERRRGAPPALAPDLLRRLLGYHLQEQKHGGLSGAAQRALREIARGDRPRLPRIELKAGTRLIRSWQGRSFTVLVTEAGYLFEDRLYRSLSQIARAITGAHWSGPRFFGLTGKAAQHG